MQATKRVSLRLSSLLSIRPFGAFAFPLSLCTSAHLLSKSFHTITAYIDRNNQIYITMNEETKRIVLKALLEVDPEMLLTAISDFIPDSLINSVAKKVIEITAKKKK